MNILRYVFGFLLLIHGLIHLMGFVKALGLADIDQLSRPISRPMGWVWLLAGTLLIVASSLYFLKNAWWPGLALTALVISQILVIGYWTDAKYGTLANLIILIAVIIIFATRSFENGYKRDLGSAMEKMAIRNEIVTEKDIEKLPEPVRNYLRYVDVVGKPKIQNAKIVFTGEMREKGKSWFNFTSEQYNFFDHPTRLFFMKAKVNGLPTTGYHRYWNGDAGMQIKVFSLFPVVAIKGREMFPTETVTFFNDLCLFAPAALIDDRITWESMDENSAKATFTTNGTSISAILYFNETGQLVNFVSNDRYSVSEMKAFPFSTPAKNYRYLNGYRLPTYGEGIWQYPDGAFVYGKFNVKSVEYNISPFK